MDLQNRTRQTTIISRSIDEGGNCEITKFIEEFVEFPDVKIRKMKEIGQSIHSLIIVRNDHGSAHSRSPHGKLSINKAFNVLQDFGANSRDTAIAMHFMVTTATEKVLAGQRPKSRRVACCLQAGRMFHQQMWEKRSRCEMRAGSLFVGLVCWAAQSWIKTVS